MVGAQGDKTRLSARYERMAQLCVEYADDAADPSIRKELLGMAEFYRAHASRESDSEVRSNAVPPAAANPSAFRFAALGRNPGLGAQTSAYGSD